MSKQTKMVAIRPPPIPDEPAREGLIEELGKLSATGGAVVVEPATLEKFGDDPTQDGPDGPVYVFAMWRDGPHGHRRVRAHLPLEVVLAGAVCEPSPADMRSRVVGAIEGELTSESINRNVPWER